jgi:hypothetical protein
VRGQEHADGLLRAAVALVVAESPPCVEHRAVDRDREHEPVEPGRALRHSPEPREPADLGNHNPPKGEQSRLTSDTDQRSSEAEQRAFEIVRLFELDDSLIEGLADRTTVSVNSCSRTEGRALGAALRLLSWTTSESEYRCRAGSCFALAERASQEAGPAHVELVQWSRGDP